jgi:hypothetical protein
MLTIEENSLRRGGEAMTPDYPYSARRRPRALPVSEVST